MLNHKGTRILKTQRLTLRKFDNNDATDFFTNWGSDKRVANILGYEPLDNIFDSSQIISEWIQGYKSKNVYNWAIQFDSHVIGTIKVVGFDEQNEYAEIGFCLGYNFWGQGFISEAICSVTQYLLCDVGFNKLIITCEKDNIGCNKAAQKCGYTLDGTLRQHEKRYDNSFTDVSIYSFTKSDFNSSN